MSSTVKVISTRNGEDFLGRAKDWLNLNESDNNTILSIAGQAGSHHSMLRPPFWFGLAETSQGFCGAAVFAAPDGLVLSEMQLAHVPPLLQSLLSARITPTRIYAPAAPAETASSLLFDETGQSWYQRTQWVSFVTTTLVQPPDPELGYLRRATQSDTDLVEKFGHAYALERPSIVDVAAYFLNKIRTNELFLWVGAEDHDVKTLVAISGSTDNVIRIAGVFTSTEHRCLGHASAAVATVTNALLEANYRTVTLVIDRQDARSRHLYENLGYIEQHVRVELVVKDPGDLAR